MNFSWTTEQEKLYQDVLHFARQRLAGLPGNAAEFPHALWREAGDFGLLGLPVSSEFGGLGLDAVTTARVLEALGRGCTDLGFVFSLAAHLFACVMPIFEHGSELQKRELLPKLCSGAWVGANAITESEAGSDVFAMKSTARRERDGYRLDGSKSYVSNGPIANWFLAYAMNNPAHGYLGISAFLIPRQAEGLRVGKPFEKMGLHTSPISTVYFEQCYVPESYRLGPEGNGATIFNNSMRWERACLFAMYVGAMERILEKTVAHAKTRSQFKKPIGKNQSISHRIADMSLRLEASRMLLYRACWMMDNGRAVGDADLAVSQAKVTISEAAIQSGHDAIQIHGGMGYLTEVGVESFLRDATPSTIFSGTSEMHRNIIATKLGL